jgi:hypothetical protein
MFPLPLPDTWGFAEVNWSDPDLGMSFLSISLPLGMLRLSVL